MVDKEKKLFKGVMEECKPFKARATGKDMYSFKIGQVSFSGFGECPGKNGDSIEFEYIQNVVGDKTYNNVLDIHKVDKIKESMTSGEMIGESAKKKRLSEMMMVAKDIVELAYKDEKLTGDKEFKIAEIVGKVRIVWADLCKQIGENPDV